MINHILNQMLLEIYCKHNYTAPQELSHKLVLTNILHCLRAKFLRERLMHINFEVFVNKSNDNSGFKYFSET